MSDNNFSAYVPRDEKGNALKYDGLDDYGVWESAFKADMARKGHGCVLNNDSSGPPTKPEDALRRIRRHTENYNDRKDAMEYKKEDEKFKVHCEFVFASAKMALGTTERSFIDLDVNMKDASYRNIEKMFRHLVKRYGGYTNSKHQRNYYAMLAIAKFTSIDTTLTGLNDLKILMDERALWTGESFKESFYREWLLTHMESWEVINFQYKTMEADETMSFRKGRRLVIKYMEVLRQKNTLAHPLAVEMNAALAMHKTMSTNPLPVPANTGFTITDNMVTMTLEELQAKLVNAKTHQHVGFRKVVICYNCNNEGHLARDCKQQPRQRLMQNSQHSLNQSQSQTGIQQQRFLCPTEPTQLQNQEQRLPTLRQQQDRNQPCLVQPTVEQMQVFQQFVQQQAKGRMQTQFQSSSGSKRVGSFDGRSLGQPNAKRKNK